MTASILLMISIREFFGFLVPGFVWVLILCHFNVLNSSIFAELAETLKTDKMLFYSAVIFLSYFLGYLFTFLSFRIVDFIGIGIDFLMSKTPKASKIRGLFEFIANYFHIFNFISIDEEAEKLNNFSSNLIKEQDVEINKGGRKKRISFEVCKLYVLENSSILGRDILKIEGELNFLAGMFLPVVFIGINCFPDLKFQGILLFFVALFFAFRFQRLRHLEIISVGRALKVIKAKNCDYSQN